MDITNATTEELKDGVIQCQNIIIQALNAQADLQKLTAELEKRKEPKTEDAQKAAATEFPAPTAPNA